MKHIVFGLLFLSFSPSKGAINDIFQRLNQIKVENETSLLSQNQEAETLRSRISSLQRQLEMAQNRLSTIEQNDNPDLKPLFFKLTSQEISSLFDNKSFGPCHIRKGKEPSEYILTQTESKTTLRFYFAPENSDLSATAELKTVGLQNEQWVIEVLQDYFKPAGIEPSAEMYVKVRFDAQTLQPTLSTFRGLKKVVSYYLFTSYVEDQISCQL